MPGRTPPPLTCGCCRQDGWDGRGWVGVGSDAPVGQVVSPLDVEEHPSGALSFDPSARLLGSLSLP